MPRRRIAPKFVLLVSVAALTAAGLVATSSSSGVAAPTDEVTGTVAEQHGDDFSNGVEIHMGDVVESGNKIVRVHLPKGSRLLGQHVQLKGNYSNTSQGKTLEVTSAAPVPAAASSAVSTGVRNVAVLMVNFTNDTRQPWDANYGRGVMFTNTNSVNALYQAASDGQTSLSGDVFGWYTLPMANTSCDYLSVRSLARAAATAAGVNLSLYRYTVYVFPGLPCGWSGLGDLPGTSSWINGSFSTGVIAHELGHNFGVHHASSLSCTFNYVRVTLSDTCTASEYGDPFDVMGSGNIHIENNWHRAELGWMDNQTVATTGTYQLAPANGPATTAPRLIQIARPNGTYFHLEIREPTPIFDNYAVTAPVVNGVSLRIAPSATSTSIVQSKLLDATPATSTFSDAALTAGQSFTDQYGTGASNVKITTVAASPTGATIQVQFGAAPPGGTTTTTSTSTTTTTTSTTTTTTTTRPTTTTAPPPPPPPPPPGTPGTTGFVRLVTTGQKSQSGNASMTLTVPAGGGAAAGHRVIVTAAVGTFAGAVTCKDNKGNTYTVDGRSSANNLFVCSAHLANALQPGDAITLTYPGFSGASQATASEFSGIAAVSPVDGTFRTGTSTSSKTVAVTPALATTNAHDLLFAAVGSNGTFKVGSSFAASGGLGGVATAYRSVTALGSFSTFGTVTWGSWRSILVAYRAA